ncbi:MAG: hypothetical protein NC115_00460 [Bacteroidales bacterium]|nr:hypothetical protein [Bacteroidales bacterium]
MEGNQTAQVGGNNDQPAPSTSNTTAWKATRQRRLAETMTNLHHQPAIQQHGRQPGSAGWRKQQPTRTIKRQYNNMEGNQTAQVGRNNDQPAPSTSNTTAWKATRQRRLAIKITNPHHQKAIQQHGKQSGSAGWQQR